MAGAKTVHMGQHGGDAAGLWREAVPAQQRIEPDQPAGGQVQPFDLAREGGGVVV